MRKRWLATVCGAILFGNLVGPLAQGADPAAPGSRDWPQWRGPHRDGISLQQNLAKSWPKDGPTKLWEVKDAGIGYSSVAIQGNRLYTLGDLDGVEHVIAMETATGKRKIGRAHV